MSSSSSAKIVDWGRIFMGPSPADEGTLLEVEGHRSMAWDDKTEAEYLDRVKNRATQAAAEIMAKAQLEAEQLKEAARQEGYNTGLQQAQQEIDAFQQTMSESVSGVLGAIQGQCSNIFQQWRGELLTMLRVSVQKALALELTEQRNVILEQLFIQSVDALANQKSLVVRVNPEDEPAVAEIISATQQRFPGLEAWTVKADAVIGAGGMVVESTDGMVDNTIESRVALVDNILSQLMIPEDSV